MIYRIQQLEVSQEELTKLNLEQSSQFTSEREQRLLAETNLVQLQEQIKILQQQQSPQDVSQSFFHLSPHFFSSSSFTFMSS